MPVSRLERNFKGVIDRLAPIGCGPSIYPIAFDRQTAQRRRVLVDVFPTKAPKQTIALPVAVGWIGDAFIDALADYVRWDDRGLALPSGDTGPNRCRLAGRSCVSLRFSGRGRHGALLAKSC